MFCVKRFLRGVIRGQMLRSALNHVVGVRAMHVYMVHSYQRFLKVLIHILQIVNMSVNMSLNPVASMRVLVTNRLSV